LNGVHKEIMKFKLDHIGLIVENIEDFKKIVRILNPDTVTTQTADPIQKVSASFVRIGEESGVYVELLEPTDETSPVMNFLKKRGGGLHHLCFEVDNIEEASKMLVKEGFAMVTPPVECSAYDKNFKRDCIGVTRIAFFMMTDHLLIELIEKGT